MNVRGLVHASDEVVRLFNYEMPVVAPQVMEDYWQVEIVVIVDITFLVSHASKLARSVVVVSAFNIAFQEAFITYVAAGLASCV